MDLVTFIGLTFGFTAFLVLSISVVTGSVIVWQDHRKRKENAMRKL